MSEVDSSIAADAEATPPRSRRRRSAGWAVTALIVSLIALGLATIPQTLVTPDPVEPRLLERAKSSVTLKIKSLSLSLGKDKPDAPPAVTPPSSSAATLRAFSAGAIGCALVAIALGTFAHVRERHPYFTATTTTCAIAAITWQWVAMGIMVGVAVAVLLVILYLLAQSGI